MGYFSELEEEARVKALHRLGLKWDVVRRFCLPARDFRLSPLRRQLLDVKIDYRDGLVDFSYNSKP